MACIRRFAAQDYHGAYMRVLIVGGSGGIGSATALACARKNWWPIIGYHSNPLNAQHVLNQSGLGEIIFLNLLEEDCGAPNGLPVVDAVVHCAGAASQNDNLLDAPEDTLKKLLDLHALGPLRITRAVASGSPQLRTVIFILSSAAADRGGGPYTFSKLVGLSVCKLLAVELNGRGVCVHAVLPGWTETAMAMKAATLLGRSLADIRMGHIDGRLLEPSEVGTLCVDLLAKCLGERGQLVWWDRRVSREPLFLRLDSVLAIPGAIL